MKLKELIEQLTDFMDEDAVVVLKTQPDRHPLYYAIGGVDDEDGVIVLIEGSQIGYSPHVEG